MNHGRAALSVILICLMPLLFACGQERELTRDDVVGSYCGSRKSSSWRMEVAYRLSLTAGQGYRYSLTPVDARAQGSSYSGAYQIYGDVPVNRVELRGICLQWGRCTDYPAEIQA